MDANGQQFWSLSNQSDWRLIGEPAALEYDHERRSLRLANQRRELNFSEDIEAAAERLEITPQTLDRYGNRAYYDEPNKIVLSTSSTEEQIRIYATSEEEDQITDIAMGYDDVLYIALNGKIIMHDRRQR